MCKISEKKALEAYPNKYTHTPFGINIADINDFKREAYTEGYDQAMQDFLEYLKYCSTFTDTNGNARIDNDLLSALIDDFKNYIQNESENKTHGYNY
ncbi:MAG: hypothetical protein J6S67_17325 [Methanobrevibacter sp.]|nr:hypothetical protein [Methanobrevibacter sp.]